MTLKLLLYAVYPYQHHLVQIHSRWIAWVMKPHSEPEGSYNLVGLAGLEPATSSLSVKRSNLLNYRTKRNEKKSRLELELNPGHIGFLSLLKGKRSTN